MRTSDTEAKYEQKGDRGRIWASGHEMKRF